MQWLKKRKLFKEKFNNLSSSEKLEYYYRFENTGISFNVYPLIFFTFLSTMFMVFLVAFTIPDLFSMQDNAIDLLNSVFAFFTLGYVYIFSDIVFNLIFFIVVKYKEHKWFKEKGLR
jgi:type II secretory pathway component PulF